MAARVAVLAGDGRRRGSDGGNPRIEALVATTDGFELAEVDLDLRGEGTIMNTAQKGRSDLKLASLRRDRELVVQAREAAFEIVDADPLLERIRFCSTRSVSCSAATTRPSCSSRRWWAYALVTERGVLLILSQSARSPARTARTCPLCVARDCRDAGNRVLSCVPNGVMWT